MPTAAQATWSNQKLEPLYSPELARLMPVKLPNSINYAKGTVLGEIIGTNERQKLVITGGPTGGTFTMTFGGQTTAAIAYNAPASDIRDALEAISTILDGSVSVTGGPLPGAPVYIEFRGAQGAANVAALTTTDSLTGGSSPATAVTTVTGGAAGTAGTFKAYDNDNTDGSERPKAILAYSVSTDSSGNITYTDTSSQAGGEFGQQVGYVPAYVSGYFDTADLTGLDVRASESPGWRMVNGTLAAGCVALGV